MKKLFIFASLLYSFAAQANSSYFENLVRQMQAHQNDPLIADMELQTGNENISYRVYKKGKRVRTDFTMNDVTGYTFTDDHKTTFFIPAQNVLTVQENEGGSPFLIPDAQTFEGCSVGSPIQINGMECRPIKCSNAGEQLDLCISETYYIPVQTTFGGGQLKAKSIRKVDFSDDVLTPPTRADAEIQTPQF